MAAQEQPPECPHRLGHGFVGAFFGNNGNMAFNTVRREDGFSEVVACDGNRYLMTDQGTDEFPAGTLLPYDEHSDWFFPKATTNARQQ